MNTTEIREQLGEINYMTKDKFEDLIELMDLTNSQRKNINVIMKQVDKELDKPESQIPLFGIPTKIGSELWITIRSETINGTMLCITDRWYTVKLGKRGKLTISGGSWDEDKYKIWYLMF